MDDISSEITISDEDLTEIRAWLMDYYGTATFAASPLVQADLIRVQNMNPQELVHEALRLGIVRISYDQ